MNKYIKKNGQLLPYQRIHKNYEVNLIIFNNNNNNECMEREESSLDDEN